jgi:hypothetical protein
MFVNDTVNERGSPLNHSLPKKRYTGVESTGGLSKAHISFG